jgi:hypothetical protein
MPSRDRFWQSGIIREAPFADSIARWRTISVRAAAGPVFNTFPAAASFAGFVASYGEQRPLSPNESGQGKQLP